MHVPRKRVSLTSFAPPTCPLACVLSCMEWPPSDEKHRGNSHFVVASLIDMGQRPSAHSHRQWMRLWTQPRKEVWRGALDRWGLVPQIPHPTQISGGGNRTNINRGTFYKVPAHWTCDDSSTVGPRWDPGAENGPPRKPSALSVVWSLVHSIVPGLAPGL